MKKVKADDLIRDYHWMLNVIRNYLQELDDSDQQIVAQYGIEASMPKAQGSNADPVLKVVERREKKWRKIARYQGKICFIDQHSARIKGESERFVLDSVLDGKTLAAVARDMGLTWKKVATIYDHILEEIVEDVEDVEKGERMRRGEACV